MDKRFFLALLLTAIVIVAPPLLFQNKNAPRPSAVAMDSTAGRPPVKSLDSTGRSSTQQTAVGQSAPVAPAAPSTASGGTPTSTPVVPVDTSRVRTRLATYAFSSLGSVPISVSLDSYPSRRPGN